MHGVIQQHRSYSHRDWQRDTASSAVPSMPLIDDLRESRVASVFIINRFPANLPSTEPTKIRCSDLRG
jgi:hypothetical protein